MQAGGLHSLLTCSDGKPTLKAACVFSCASLTRFDDGLCFSSNTVLCGISEDSLSIPKGWEPPSKGIAEVWCFQIDGKACGLRFREIHRIGWDNVLKKGYFANSGMSKLMQNSLLSHFDESWNEKRQNRVILIYNGGRYVIHLLSGNRLCYQLYRN